MNKETLKRLIQEARDITRETSASVAYLTVLEELMREERKKEITFPPPAQESVTVSMVYGDSLPDLEDKARTITGMPGGKVAIGTMISIPDGSPNRNKGAYFATARVAPAQPSENLFTEREMQRAAEDLQNGFGLGGTTPAKFISRLVQQVRKNRTYDA